MSIGIIVVVSIVVFLVVMLLLVGVLIYARMKLVPQGRVNIKINEDKELEVDPGC
jgi:Na+-transporting NADH:ubiquinone oxidoreductase subunit F